MATTTADKPPGKRGRPRRTDGLEPSAARYTVPPTLMPLILKLTNGADRDTVITQLLTEALSARLHTSPKQNAHLSQAASMVATQHIADTVAEKLTANLEQSLTALTGILVAAAQQHLAATAQHFDHQARLCQEREQKLVTLIDSLATALSPFMEESEHKSGTAATLERIADRQLTLLEALKILNEDMSLVRSSIFDGDQR